MSKTLKVFRMSFRQLVEVCPLRLPTLASQKSDGLFHPTKNIQIKSVLTDTTKRMHYLNQSQGSKLQQIVSNKYKNDPRKHEGN